MRPKVALVIPDLREGGAESMVSQIVSNMDISKVDIEVICICGAPYNNPYEIAIQNSDVEIKYIGKGRGFSLSSICKLWRELSRYQPDVVHTHLSACVYCAPWVLLHRVSMLHTVHNIPERELITPKRLVMSVMYKLHKAIPVAISHQIQSLVESYYRLDKKPEIVYNPVNIARFSIPKMRHIGTVLVTVGRLSIQKNQKLLIDAVGSIKKKHPDVKLWILGDGPLREELEEYIIQNKLDSTVHLYGNVTNVESYFSKSDIFVLSSDYEGLPLVVLEAMAASLPIVSTDVGGVRDLVTDNGILVHPKDREGLETAIERLIGDVELRVKMGTESLRSVQDYESSIIAGKYLELYQKCCEQ